MWLDHLPASVAFCDVETTGLGNARPHRKLWRHRNDQPRPGQRPAGSGISIPGVRSWERNSRGAERIHGFSDSALRLQDPFAVHAADVWHFLTSYDLIVAHNAAFDIRFINREMRLSGLPALTRPVYCTMKGYRALDLGGSASLSAVCQHIKLARAGDLHDAIEDAWLAMQIYLWLHGCPLQRRLRSSLPRTPSNLRHTDIGPYRAPVLRTIRPSASEPAGLSYRSP